MNCTLNLLILKILINKVNYIENLNLIKKLNFSKF